MGLKPNVIVKGRKYRISCKMLSNKTNSVFGLLVQTQDIPIDTYSTKYEYCVSKGNKYFISRHFEPALFTWLKPARQLGELSEPGQKIALPWRPGMKTSIPEPEPEPILGNIRIA